MFAVAMAAAAILTYFVGLAAVRFRVLDCPDGKRKLHGRPVPLLGGVAVYLAVLVGLASSVWFGFDSPVFAELATAIAAAAGFVCLVGCIDDCCRLTARVKLFLQTCGVIPIVLAGHYAERIFLFGVELNLGWLGVPLTALWLLGCINAINLLDGMDGLASVVGASTALMMGILAAAIGSYYVAGVAVVLAGAVAGFFLHNRPPAKIFLGDSGSMVIGLIVGLLGVEATLKTTATLSIAAPLVVMTFPMFDTVLAVVRRKLSGRRFDVADRQHIHHRLLDRGMNPWVVLAIIGTLCLATGSAAIAATLLRWESLAWITAAVLLMLVVRLRLFGHYEVAMVAGALARMFAGLAARLAAFAAPTSSNRLDGLGHNEAWQALVEQVRPWRVQQIELMLSAAEGFRWRQVWIDARAPQESACAWTLIVRVDAADGQSCEVHAAGFEPSGPEFLYPSGLSRLLKVFADHFAKSVSDPPPEIVRKAA